MEILVLKERIKELEIEMKNLKVEIVTKLEAFEEFLTKFEGGKKIVKKTKED